MPTNTLVELERFDFYLHDAHVSKSETGKWVKFDDVEKLIALKDDAEVK